MRWFGLFRNSGRKAAAPKEQRRRRRRPLRPVPDSRKRRERYSGWNDPDLPTYGDPFDG